MNVPILQHKYGSPIASTPANASMSYPSQTSSYREMELLSASPARLVVIVFEQLVVNLERARIAMERNDIELRVTALRRARVGCSANCWRHSISRRVVHSQISWRICTSSCCTN